MWQEEGPLDRIWVLLPTCIAPTHMILVESPPLHRTETTVRRRVMRDGTGSQLAIPLSGIKKSVQWNVKPRDDSILLEGGEFTAHRASSLGMYQGH